MAGKKQNNGSTAVRLFRLLLYAYPRSFRERFGAEMIQVFCDLRREAGRNAAAFWGRILWDTLAAGWKERQDEMRRSTMALLGAALAVGAAIAWVDSRPTWDDTGITAGALLFSSALFGAAEPRHPLLWALAIGVWIPLYAILHTGNFSMILVLLFPLAGAYLGAGLRKAFAPPSAPTGDRP